MNPKSTSQTNQVDPTALSLSRAIRQAEGGDYNNTSGDNGTSAGAYQWNNGKLPLEKGSVPANFKSAAQKHGLDPNDFSETNQDHVAYEDIKKDLDSGLSQSQIAAKWNSGLTHGWENHVGTTTINGKSVAYDTPGYVKKVQQYYEQDVAKGNSGFNPTPYSHPDANGAVNNPGQVDFSGSGAPAEQSNGTLGSELTGRVNDASQAITDITTGKQNIGSGLIQVAGAAGGAVGDVVNKGLELIPGVKQVESLLGQGVGKLLQTQTGQSVAKSIKDFSEAHPELSKDIGAGFNIITAIPILRGLGAVKGVALDAASQALKGVAEKSATKGLTELVSGSATGRKLLARNPEGIKTLIDERALPDIEGGKYTVGEADARLNQQISHIEENELQPALAKADVSQISSRIPLEEYRQQAIADAKEELMSPSQVNTMFDLIKEKYGDYPTLSQMNEAKRTVSKRISEAAFGSPEATSNKLVRASLQKSIEDGAEKLGLADVRTINKKMARLIKAQKLLKYMEGKGVKTGTVGKVLQEGAAAGGEAAGNMTGIPLVGAYTAYKAGGFLGKKLSGIGMGILKRTGKGAVKESFTNVKGKIKGLVKGAAAQKAAD